MNVKIKGRVWVQAFKDSKWSWKSNLGFKYLNAKG